MIMSRNSIGTNGNKTKIQNKNCITKLSFNKISHTRRKAKSFFYDMIFKVNKNLLKGFYWYYNTENGTN